MNELQIFNNPEFGDIRTVEIDGEPWLVGKDVAQALGYSDTKSALSDHVDPEDKMQGDGVTIRDSMGREQHPTIINESGLYALIFSSKLPGAKKFKHWVTSEVLPSIRKHHGYLSPEAAEQLNRVLAGFEHLTKRVEALEEAQSAPKLTAPASGGDCDNQVPGKAFRKRWMRTASEKLDLMSNRFNLTNNGVLHQIYQFLEKHFDVALEEERLRTMEEYGLAECSVLTAVFYDPEFRAYFQEIVDHNLAPENRGW